MADEPPESPANDDPAYKPTLPPPAPPRRSLPRGARLSRLQPGGTPPPSQPVPPTAATPEAGPSLPVEPAVRPGRPREMTPVEELAALVARDNPEAKVAERPPSRALAGQQLTALEGGLIKEPIVTSDRSRGATSFKAIVDKGAQRSVMMSTVGLVLCLVPVLSLLGLVWGIASLRRIRRSDGELFGEKTARFGIYLGVIGLVVGATLDMVLIIRS